MHKRFISAGGEDVYIFELGEGDSLQFGIAFENGQNYSLSKDLL